ncbi:MAG: DoxX family protein [Candidatus Omnitrophota bacterium]
MRGEKGSVSWGLLWLRFLMGMGIASHGYQKIFGGQMAAFVENITQLGFPVPNVFAWFAALSEFGGGLLIVFGLGTRLAALLVFLTMSMAVFRYHRFDAFPIKETALAYWTMAGTLIFLGAGTFSLDRLLRRKKKESD